MSGYCIDVHQNFLQERLQEHCHGICVDEAWSLPLNYSVRRFQTGRLLTCRNCVQFSSPQCIDVHQWDRDPRHTYPPTRFRFPLLFLHFLRPDDVVVLSHSRLSLFSTPFLSADRTLIVNVVQSKSTGGLSGDGPLPSSSRGNFKICAKQEATSAIR